MSITVREWIEKFNNGEFDSKDIKTQCIAGWIDWHCAEEELPGRLKAMGNIIKNIKDDYILDNFKVDFKNNCPVYSPLFDYFRFTPIKKGKEAIDSNIVNKLTFGVECGHPFGGDFMYEIFTGRSGYSVEFHCKNEQEVLKVITQLAKELQKWFLLLDIGCSVIKCAAPNKVFQLLAYTKKILTDNSLLEAKDTDILYRDKTGEYMVGSLAFNTIFSRIEPGSEKDFFEEHRYRSNDFFILSRTAIALGLLPLEDSDGKDLIIGVDNEEVKEALLGEHAFELKLGKNDWVEYSFTLTDNIIKVINHEKMSKLYDFDII